MVRLCIFLLIVTTVVFVALMVLPDVLKPFGSVLCGSGQQLTTKQTTYSTEPGETTTSIQFYCSDGDGQPREITGQMIPVIAIGFTGLLGLGILLIIVGAGRLTRTATTQLMREGKPITWNTPSQTATLDDLMNDLPRGVVRFGGQEIPLDELKSEMYQHVVTNAGKHTLAETLRQLTDAHNQKLITDDEYQRLRQEALDKLV